MNYFFTSCSRFDKSPVSLTRLVIIQKCPFFPEFRPRRKQAVHASAIASDFFHSLYIHTTRNSYRHCVTAMYFSKERAFYSFDIMVYFRILFSPSPTYLNNLPLGGLFSPLPLRRTVDEQISAHTQPNTRTLHKYSTQIPRPICSRVLGPVFIYVYTIIHTVCYLPVGIVGSW